MDSLNWLVKYCLKSLLRREHDWVFTFDGQAQLLVSCLWRLLEAGRIRFASQDDGQWFGLPASIDAAAELNSRIGHRAIELVMLRDQTLDLELQFDTGHVLQVIPDSSGYEAWEVLKADMSFSALGGGDLAYFGSPMAND